MTNEGKKLYERVCCPECGSTRIKVSSTRERAGHDLRWILCEACGARFKDTDGQFALVRPIPGKTLKLET